MVGSFFRHPSSAMTSCRLAYDNPNNDVVMVLTFSGPNRREPYLSTIRTTFVVMVGLCSDTFSLAR